MKESELRERWKDIQRMIESTKDSDLDRTLIVPLADWNPSILSNKRKRMLLMIKEREIESETHLARLLGRKRPNVVADLKLLEHYGLIERIKQGRRTIPIARKTQIIIY